MLCTVDHLLLIKCTQQTKSCVGSAWSLNKRASWTICCKHV